MSALSSFLMRHRRTVSSSFEYLFIAAKCLLSDATSSGAACNHFAQSSTDFSYHGDLYESEIGGSVPYAGGKTDPSGCRRFGGSRGMSSYELVASQRSQLASAFQLRARSRVLLMYLFLSAQETNLYYSAYLIFDIFVKYEQSKWRRIHFCSKSMCVIDLRQGW